MKKRKIVTFNKMEENEYLNNNIFHDFLLIVNIDKIFSFYQECLKYNDKIKNEKKISKTKFIKVCETVISSDKKYNIIFNLIYEKFKEKKCVFKKIYNRNSNQIQQYKNKNNFFYSLSEIYTTGKIDVYVVELFLCAIIKTKFKIKLEAMFYITDIDFDGLISEKEIKKLIFTIYQIFSDESSQFPSDSSLIKQSLSSMKAKKIYYEIMHGQGNLYEKLNKKKVINFEEFFDAISKIDNYKYEIIPTFIDIKKFLLTKKSELKFTMTPKNKNFFMKISNELVNKANLNSNSSFNKIFLKNCFDINKTNEKKDNFFLKEKIMKNKNLRGYRGSYLKNNLSSYFQRNSILTRGCNFVMNNIQRNKSFIIPKKLLNENNSFKNFFSSKYSENNISFINPINKNINSKKYKNSKTLNASLINNPKKILKRSNYSINVKSIRNKLLFGLSRFASKDIKHEKNDSFNNPISERGEYSKFNNIFFSPCLIEVKPGSLYNTNYLSKGSILKLKKKKASSFNKVKESFEMKPIEKIKEEIFNNLKYYKNLNANNGLEALVLIQNQIEGAEKRFFDAHHSFKKIIE